MDSEVPIKTLCPRLDFSAGATNNITNDQGIDNLDELKLLNDNDCENLCKSIRCPGEKVFGQGGVDIPNPGISVSLRANMNLILTTYYLWHLDKISRTICEVNVTLLVVRLIISLKERQ